MSLCIGDKNIARQVGYLAFRAVIGVSAATGAQGPKKTARLRALSSYVGIDEYRIFKRPFSMAQAIAQGRKSCQFLFCLMKNPLLYRSAWPESSREASERLLMETLGRTQSERRRWLALAGWFSAVRLSGIDRLDAPAHAAGRGSAGPDD